MFTVKLVARPDPRMVEVPLEIEAELPRDFDGAALLAASGLPRKVRFKAQRDALKLSTAYRTDQLVGDIVRTSLRGTAADVQRVQEAVGRFSRTVRERRQDGATLLVSSNGRGKIEVAEQLPQPTRPPPPAPGAAAQPAAVPSGAQRLAALERKVAQMEAAFEQRIGALQAQLTRALAAADVAGPGMEAPRAATPVGSRPQAATHTVTAVEAYAEGLRRELQEAAGGALSRARTETDRCDKAAALAAEAELLGAPADGTSQRLREASTRVAARHSALERLSQEIELYPHADLRLAEQLLRRLAEGVQLPDAAAALEPVAQAVVRTAKGGDCRPRTRWLERAAALCGWQLVTPARGEPLNPEWHHAVDSGAGTVVRLACPGLKRADGSGLVRARVQVDPAAAAMPEEPEEPPAVPEPLVPPSAAPDAPRHDASRDEALAIGLAQSVATAMHPEEEPQEISDDDVEELHQLDDLSPTPAPTGDPGPEK